jgi:hypothetical protein
LALFYIDNIIFLLLKDNSCGNSVGDDELKEENKYSANFKKDYMAYFAIGLFIVIVIIELYMAIWLPIYLKSQNSWALQENRQEMIDRFDGLRSAYSRLKPATQQGKAEIKIIMDCLNHNAIYLRKYQEQLTIDQIRTLNSGYQELAIFLKVYRKKDKASGKFKSALGKQRQLKTKLFIDKLRRKAEQQLTKNIQQYKKNGYIK